MDPMLSLLSTPLLGLVDVVATLCKQHYDGQPLASCPLGRPMKRIRSWCGYNIMYMLDSRKCRSLYLNAFKFFSYVFFLYSA